jgi:rubrerythrin
MSVLGLTKGTELEEEVEQYLKAESQGVTMYCGLARLAEERGLKDVSKILLKLAGDEARHAGLYSALNGHVSQDIFTVLSQVAKVEIAAKDRINLFAQKARSMGLDKVADEIELTAEDEGRHGILLEELIKTHIHSRQE